VMEVYGGKLRIENAMPSGLRVSLLLPRPEPRRAAS
jgi:hypothetical protein